MNRSRCALPGLRRSPTARPRLAQMLGLALAFTMLTLGGCKARGARSPEDLRAAYAKALKNDDPDAAYALLSPELQARIDIEEFRRRWKRDAKERDDALEALESLDQDRSQSIRSGSTMHDGGLILEWVRVGDDYVVASGLPGIPETSTPESTIRALIAALRQANDDRLAGILAPELLERAEQDWDARAEAIERAIAEPGAITYSADNMRAILRYAPGRAIVLEQSEHGWRVLELR